MTAWRSRLAPALLGIFLVSQPAASQDANSPFASFKHDSTQPIEVTSDSLTVNQTRKIATFAGSVVAGQGTLRMTAARIEIHYNADTRQSDTQTGRIRLMKASGGVFLSNGSEAAEGEWAEYDVIKGIITMGGNVLLTQGENAISGQELWINLNEGVGEIKGRVTTVFQPAAADEDN